MASEKARYWMALGLIALTFGSSFMNKQGEWTRGLLDHSLQLAQEVSGQTMGYLVQGIVGENPIRVAYRQSVAAQLHSRLACMQTVIARQQSSFAQIQAERARILAMEQVRQAVRCPRQTLTIEVPQAPVIQNDGTI